MLRESPPGRWRRASSKKRPDAGVRLALSGPLSNEVGACFDLNRQVATPGGLSVEELSAAVGAVREATDVAAVTISAYDPAHDPGGGVRAALGGVLEAVAA